MPEDFRQKLISHIEKWQAQAGPGGVGLLVVDREGQLYFVGYAGMGSYTFIPLSETNPYFPSIRDLLNEGWLKQEEFEPAYEMGFKEVAYLKLQKHE
jgi:hypothetical protein